MSLKRATPPGASAAPDKTAAQNLAAGDAARSRNGHGHSTHGSEANGSIPNSGSAAPMSVTRALFEFARNRDNAEALKTLTADAEARFLSMLGNAETHERIQNGCLASGAKRADEAPKFASFCQRLAVAELRQGGSFEFLKADPEMVREAIVNLAAVGLPLNSAAKMARLDIREGRGGAVSITPIRMLRGYMEMLRTFALRTAETLTGEQLPQVSVLADEWYAQDAPPLYGIENGERVFKYHRNVGANPGYGNQENTVAGAFAVVRVPGVPLFVLIKTRAQIERGNQPRMSQDGAYVSGPEGPFYKKNPEAFYTNAVMRAACRSWVQQHGSLSESGLRAVERIESADFEEEVAAERRPAISLSEPIALDLAPTALSAGAVKPVINFIEEDDESSASREERNTAPEPTISATPTSAVEERPTTEPPRQSGILWRGRIP